MRQKTPRFVQSLTLDSSLCCSHLTLLAAVAALVLIKAGGFFKGISERLYGDNPLVLHPLFSFFNN